MEVLRECKTPMPPALAKLTRPRLYGAVARARLFQLLDEQREHPVVWISGPPGSGKTTLVASYVTEREVPGIWYQIDSGDADPATFFYYMGLAAERAVRGRRVSLPLLTNESLPDLIGFGRRYARELFGRLPRGAAVILDNVQEAPLGSALAQLLEVWAEEIPEGLNLLCISRAEPPLSMMRYVSTGRIALIDWEALRLTLEETRHFAAVKHKIGDRMLARLHQQSEGWAAGLTLMLERVVHTGDLPEAIAVQSRGAIFDYFAGTLFDRQPTDVRHVLLCTALPPRITPSLASKITGNPNAGALLDSMHRRNLFTNRHHVQRSSSLASIKRSGVNPSEPIYEYHALFREFLLEKLGQDYTPSALRRLSQDVASLLENSGQVEEALELNRIAEDWDALARLLIDHASTFLRQGRGQTLREWIAMLPADAAKNRPFTQYWLGVALIPVNQSDAQIVLERAFHEFKRKADRLGQLLCAARIIEAIYRANVSQPDQIRWITVLDTLLANNPIFSSRDDELSVYCSLGLAIIYSHPRHPGLAVTMARVMTLLKDGLAPEQMVIAGEALVRYYSWSHLPGETAWIINVVSPVADDVAIPPLIRLYWWARAADGLRLFGRYREAELALRKAEGLAEYCPGHFALTMVRLFRVMLNVAQLHLAEATECIVGLKRIADPTHRLSVGFALQAESIVAAHSKSLEEAIDLCRSSLAAHETAANLFGEVLVKILLAALLAQTSRADELTVLLADTRAQLADTYLAQQGMQLSIVEAYAALQMGQEQEARDLVASVTDAKDEPSLALLCLIPRVLPTVLSFALEQDIGAARIKSWIRLYSISAEEGTNEHWPWTARIFCMGKFSLSVADKPLQFKGRAPLKPLELLKLLVSAGPGGLPARAIADRLWPDVDGAAALVNVDTNVHRLRKLFAEDPLLVNEGRVAINAKRCWVDAWALERIDKMALDADPSTLQSKAHEAMRLYRGNFLDLEAEQPWAVAYRKKLLSGLMRLIRIAGRSMEQEGRHPDAIELYERAVELDSLAEPIYRQWMLCHRERGEQVEALNVYRRCKEMLSIVLGMQPSAETRAVVATLKE